MKIQQIEKDPFHVVPYRSSGPRGEVREGELPFIRIKVDALPEGVSSFVATSDLQGREMGGENRLLGEVVAEELQLLFELKEIPRVSFAILAGDLYDYPDCRKLGGTGDVTSVWNAFAKNCDFVVGVHGNHDLITDPEIGPNISILDGDSVSWMGKSFGGISGIVGQTNRNQRKTDSEFEKSLLKLTHGKNDVVILHQGPDDPENQQLGEPMIRKVLERRGNGLVIFGHCYWKVPLIQLGGNQVLNVDSKVYLFEALNE